MYTLYVVAEAQQAGVVVAADNDTGVRAKLL
jgi:hypothetical protein